MGLNTFKTIGKPLPDRRTIVYAPAETKLEGVEGVEITQEPPSTLMARLEKEKYTELAVCGGATIYTMFMETKLVNTLYLTVEPVLFGKGIGLFTKEFDATLKLESVRKLNEQSILLEYQIVNL